MSHMRKMHFLFTHANYILFLPSIHYITEHKSVENQDVLDFNIRNFRKPNYMKYM